MTRTEGLQFITEELQGLWPQWSPTEAEMRLWLGLLKRYEYHLAREALQQAFCTQMGNYQRPKPAGFLARVRLLISKAPPRRGPEMAERRRCQVFLQCTEAPPTHPNRLGARKRLHIGPVARQDDVDYLAACSEPVRKRFDQLYGGRWITVVETPPD